MSQFLVGPIIIPFIAAAIALMWRRQSLFQHVTALVCAAIHLCAGAWLLYQVHHHGIAVLHVGGWPAPFGIALVADHLSALMVLITGVVYGAVTVYSRAEIDTEAGV